MYSGPVNESDSLTLLEVYKTDEENWEQYVPKTGSDDNTEKKEETEETTDEEEETSEEEEIEETDTTGFSLHRGEIIETYYYGEVKELSWDYDYADISTNGSLKFAEILDLNRFYKGVRLLLRKKWRAPGENVVADDLTNVLLGFITEESFNETGMDLTVSGFTKVLEENYQFSFTQMKRSEILAEMIKTAGLEPVINTEGLQDDVIDYTNVSSTSDGDDEESGDYSGSVSSDVAAMAKKVCKGKKTAKAKANAITAFICDHVKYPSPNYGDHHKCPSEVLSSGYSNCCDRARLGYEMAKVVKLKARGVHGPNHVWVQYYVDGSWQDSDPGYSRRSLGPVYNNYKMDRLWEFPSC